MLVSLIVAAVGVGVGLFAGGAWMLVRKRRAGASSRSPVADHLLPKAEESNPMAILGLEVGDVLQGGDQEYWVTGGIVLSESTGPIASVCCLSQQTDDSEVLVVEASGVRCACEPLRSDYDWQDKPSSVMVGGQQFDRTGVLHVDAMRVGDGCEAPVGSALWLTYGGPEDRRVWVVVAEGYRKAWTGRLDRMLEWRNLGGGAATLKKWD